MNEQVYSVDLERPGTGSFITITVKAVSKAQAQRKATNELPGWRAIKATVTA